MKNLPKGHVSVTQVAIACGVGRTTVGYWIRSGKIMAVRHGRNYKIPVGEPVHHLTKIGQPIPEEFQKQAGTP